jgi:hypothetical protein
MTADIHIEVIINLSPQMEGLTSNPFISLLGRQKKAYVLHYVVGSFKQKLNAEV